MDSKSRAQLQLKETVSAQAERTVSREEQLEAGTLLTELVVAQREEHSDSNETVVGPILPHNPVTSELTRKSLFDDGTSLNFKVKSAFAYDEAGLGSQPPYSIKVYGTTRRGGQPALHAHYYVDTEGLAWCTIAGSSEEVSLETPEEDDPKTTPSLDGRHPIGPEEIENIRLLLAGSEVVKQDLPSVASPLWPLQL